MIFNNLNSLDDNSLDRKQYLSGKKEGRLEIENYKDLGFYNELECITYLNSRISEESLVGDDFSKGYISELEKELIILKNKSKKGINLDGMIGSIQIN